MNQWYNSFIGGLILYTLFIGYTLDVNKNTVVELVIITEKQQGLIESHQRQINALISLHEVN